MKINGKYVRLGWTAAMLALLGLCGAVGSASAQDDQAPAPPPPGSEHRHKGPGGPGGPGDEVRFVGFEMGLEGKTVTGAPFSASFSTQSTETLSDGNKIEHSSTGTVARDSQGRTHREMTLPAIGPWAAQGKTPPHVAFVSDPVANTHYVLDEDTKVAHQLKMNRMDRMERREGASEGAGDPALRGKRAAEVVKTDLGTQTINGIVAQGTRYTRTIPAGQIGNEKPIVVTTERWYSADLQINVLTKHSDPFMGDRVTQLTGIQRTEPAATLFQVPAGYTVKQGRRGGKGGPGAPPNPPSDEE
jgi:hypothetical protein